MTVAVLAAVPWTVRHWPSQDGPNHLAVAHVLLHYGDSGSPFPRYVTVESSLRPSTATYTLLTLLGRAMPLQAAEKVLVSAGIVLLPASVLLLLAQVLPRRRTNALLALPFVVGWVFAMGFESFAIGMALGVFALAFAGDARGCAERRWHRAFASIAFVLSVWFHPVSAALTGLALLLVEGRRLARPRACLRVLVVAGPGALFLLGSLARAHGAPNAAAGETQFANPLELLGGLLETQLAYTPWELLPRIAGLALLARFAYLGTRAYSPLGASAEGGIARVVLAFLLLYCVTPVALHGWFYASTRFLLFATLLLPAMAEIPPSLGPRLLVAAPALTAAVLAVQWPHLQRASRQMQDVLDVGTSIPEKGAKIVPMDFGARLLGPQPLEHAWAELVLERDAIASQLFAAGKPRMGGESFRTLTFRPGVLDEDEGSLPWSTYEGWYDVARKCGPNPLLAWFVAGSRGCDALLAERSAKLAAVLDRYDYVLMLDPPEYARRLLPSYVQLAAHRGSAWLFRVPPHQGHGRSHSLSHQRVRWTRQSASPSGSNRFASSSRSSAVPHWPRVKAMYARARQPEARG